MNDIYQGREQTQAKHFILETYLKALAMKVLNSGYYSSLSYVDGFSGPWEARTEDFSDTSFKIALSVLSDVSKFFRDQGKPKEIRCFFVEKNKGSFSRLQTEVEPYNQPLIGFKVKAVNGQFEDSVGAIQEFTKDSFALMFIDPTGWTGYPLDKIGPLLRQSNGEILLNFMFDFINRFASSRNESIVESFEPILGKDWNTKIEGWPKPRGEAAEELFMRNLKRAGGYKFALSTKIEKTHEKRPHFALVYATRNYKGLKTFRDIEYKALSAHEEHLSAARTDAKFNRTGQSSLFAEEAGFEQLKGAALKGASDFIATRISAVTKLTFESLAAQAMEKFMVRETHVKDICVELAKLGKIEATWKLRGSKIQKPDQDDLLIWIGEDTPPTPPWL